MLTIKQYYDKHKGDDIKNIRDVYRLIDSGVLEIVTVNKEVCYTKPVKYVKE